VAIHILSDDIASQIAAGEVVERPASVVKELLENALDAQAGQISIHIEQAGRRLIEVADDGLGIPSQELPLALARHATSKLTQADDLFHITTLGFRGEALASIASVSHLTLISRQSSEEVGGCVRQDGGLNTTFEPIGAPAGTQVRVEDLFYNVPARLKFLKQDQTERQQIDALVTRYALAYPQVRTQLYEDGRPVLRSSGSGDRRELLAALYGLDIARQMLEVSFNETAVSVSGYISPISLTRSNRKEITFFVNGRWVQDSALSSALLTAYHTLLMVGRFPMAVLFLQLPPEEVDVNVHPAKAEVRFRHSDQAFSAVQRSVKRALLAYSPVPQMPGPSWQTPSFSSSPEFENSEPVPAVSSNQGFEPLTPAVQATQNPLPSGQIPLLRLIGQVGATYIVAEGPDGLYLIDQHAAHERVLFERFLKQRSTLIPAQALLEPVVVHLPIASVQTLTQQLPLLEHLGFSIEPFGMDTFLVRAIPALLSKLDPAAAVRVIVEDFEEDETPLQSEVEAKIIARVCKRAAVKAGQVLTTEEQRNLLHDLEACQSPRTCPHGRPTMIHLSVDLLERQFGRKGAR
jgi:DNA mismatch repair protein MutL